MSYKISELSANSTPAVGDIVPNVDISDTSMAASGTTKRSTLQQIADFLASLAQTLTNKTFTSPVINTGVSGTAIKDEDTMSSDSATAVPTQQSTKAYVDTHMADTTTHGTTGAIVGLSDTQTLTNKRITPRVVTATNYTTNTGTSLNCDTTDRFIVTAQAGDLLFNNPSGTPTDGQTLWIAVTGTGARALTYGNQFEASAAVALPTTTVTTARLDIGFIWVGATSKWRCVASA